MGSLLQSSQSHKQKQIMPTVEDFTDACLDGDTASVEQLLRNKPEFLNQKDGDGHTGLMSAAVKKRTDTLKLLLSKPDVDLSLQDNYGNTAITHASYSNNVDCLKLLLLHPKCTKAIVEIKDNGGKTAEMYAKSRGHQECEQLLKSFKPNLIISIMEELQNNLKKISFSVLMKSKPASDLSLEELFSEVKSLTSVQQEKESIIRKHKEIEKKEVEEFDQKLQIIEVEHKKELRKIDTKHEKELQRIEKEYNDQIAKHEKQYKDKKAKHNEALQSKQTLYAQERDDIESLFSKGEVRKQELQDIVQGSFGMMMSPQSQSIPLSVVPDCYSCLEKYRPRVKLWTCGSGHSVCGNCYDRMPNKTCGQCREPITGRATDMEKIVMSLYNLSKVTFTYK